ncbi:MAG: serine hydrolase domain-containing protein [Caldilineaceae bacterium]
MRRVWLITLLSILLICTVSAQAATVGAQPTVDGALVDRFITAQMAKQRVPGLALAVIEGEQVAYVKGYGSARSGQPVTPQTQFLIASLSKSFTAVAVLQLVEAGQVELDAPVQRYLPDFTLADPTVAAQITVRQLLNQISGLADAGFPEMRLPTPATLTDRMTQLQDARAVQPLVRPINTLIPIIKFWHAWWKW